MKNKSFYKLTIYKVIILCILSINYVKSDKTEFSISDHQSQPQYFKLYPGRTNYRNTINEEVYSNIACPNDDTGLHHYPNDLTKFIECAQGRLYKKNCPDGTYFNRKISFCDHKYNLQFDWNIGGTRKLSPHTADILCPNDITGIFPYPFDYSKYINCKNSKTWIQNCPADTKFSITRKYCMPSTNTPITDYVNYKIRVAFNNILVYNTLYKCPQNGRQNHLYPFDAVKFIKCLNYQLEIVACGAFEVFSTTRLTCLPKDEVPKSDRVPLSNELPVPDTGHNGEDDLKPSDIIICSLDLFGLYPHPFDNTKYLKCVYGRLYNETCRSGYVYSLSRKMCDIQKERRSLDTLPSIQNQYKGESIIETRSNDSLTYLKCPSTLNGSFIYPFDCTKYVQCFQGAMKIKTCSYGHLYSISKKQCQPENTLDEYDHVECFIRDENNFPADDFALGVFCSPTGSSKHPHPQDWHKYVQCVNAKLSVEHCSRDHVFSLTQRKCVPEITEIEDDDD